MSKVVEIACKRNPNLKICNSESQSNEGPPPLPPLLGADSAAKPPRQEQPIPDFTSRPFKGNLTKSEYILLRQLADQTRKVKNPFNDEGNVRLDQDLVRFFPIIVN